MRSMELLEPHYLARQPKQQEKYLGKLLQPTSHQQIG